MSSLWEKDLDMNELRHLPFQNDMPYLLRRHPMQGCRSHVLAVHDMEAVRLETRGVMDGEIRRYPLSSPVKMLRIFRKEYEAVGDLEGEFSAVKLLEEYLPGRIAHSQEFVVDYRGKPLLCGLQEFVEGMTYDPWAKIQDLSSYGSFMPGKSIDEKKEAIFEMESSLVGLVKRMVDSRGCIPDLAGYGNLVFGNDGILKLVDINNVLPVIYSDDVLLDSAGCPALDLSFHALSLIEEKATGAVDMCYRPYQHFLEPARKARAELLQKEWSRGQQEEPDFYFAN